MHNTAPHSSYKKLAQIPIFPFLFQICTYNSRYLPPLTKVFSCEFCKISKNIFYRTHLSDCFWTEFENSIRSLNFLCRLLDIKTAQINPWTVSFFPASILLCFKYYLLETGIYLVYVNCSSATSIWAL